MIPMLPDPPAAPKNRPGSLQILADDSVAAVERTLDKTWHSLMVLMGLFTAAAGLRLIVTAGPPGNVLAAAALVAVGGFAALAGHRRLQYHTNKRLAADFADAVRSLGTRS